MDENKVSIYLASNAKYFPSEKIVYIRDKLLQADESKMAVLSSISLKDPMMFLVLSIFLGSLGVDRFMLGDIGMGLLKLLTAGLCGILTVIDWVLISGKVKEANYNAIMLVL